MKKLDAVGQFVLGAIAALAIYSLARKPQRLALYDDAPHSAPPSESPLAALNRLCAS